VKFPQSLNYGVAMALRACSECKGQISSGAKVCPHCGKKQSGIGCLGTLIIGFLVIAVISVIFGNNSKSTTSNSTSGTTPPTVDAKQLALSGTTLTYHWHKGGFDSVMIADFVIKNNSAYSFKDFEIKCTDYAPSGTIIDSNDRTIFDLIPAHSTKKLPDFNMGFIHSQTAKSSCEITDLTVIQ
jgi:hypothetical protein